MSGLSRMVIILGAMTLVAGLLAILNPLAASIAAATLAGMGLLLAGLGKVAAVLEGELEGGGWPERAGPLLAAMTLLALGATVLLRPVSGAYGLLMLTGALLLGSGAAKIWWALARRQEPLFWSALVSGLLSLLLGWFILGDLRAGRVGLLGVLLGVELMLSGMLLVAAGTATRRVGRRVRTAVAEWSGDDRLAR